MDQQQFGGQHNDQQNPAVSHGGAEATMTPEPKKRGNRTFIGILVIIILIVLIAVLPDDQAAENGEAIENGEENASEVTGPNSNGTENENTNQGTTTTSTGAITYQGNTYDLGGVEWIFTPDGAQTAVRIQLTGFTRNNVAIAVLPYRLGSYAGTCREVVAPTEAETMVSGASALGFAECQTNTTRRQFGVYQNGRFVETYVRTASMPGGSFGAMSKIQTIDMAEIVSN